MVEIDVGPGAVLGHPAERHRAPTLRERLAQALVSFHLRRPVEPSRLPAILPAGVGVWLDLKAPGLAGRLGVFTPLLDGGRVVAVSTRWHNEVDEVREALPGALVFASIEHRPADPPLEAAAAGADGLAVKHAYLDRGMAAELRRAGFLLAVWTVNDREAIARALDAGVDYVITDYPADALEACAPLEEPGEREG